MRLRVGLVQYVEQTMKSFSERWNGHRAAWKSGITEDDDRAALRVHYVKSHPEKLSILLSEAFSVTFVDKPRNPRDLDIMDKKMITIFLQTFFQCHCLLFSFLYVYCTDDGFSRNIFVVNQVWGMLQTQADFWKLKEVSKNDDCDKFTNLLL